jgi:hypothetical protein
MTFISRRDLLKRAAAIGGAAAVPRAAEATRSAEAFALQRSTEAFALQREPLESLTTAEADIPDAVVARLIPTDANGPGATEARAAHYIDRALGGALASSRPSYTAGLAALDRYARSSRPCAPGNLRRSVLRRQRELRRPGCDWLAFSARFSSCTRQLATSNKKGREPAI